MSRIETGNANPTLSIAHELASRLRVPMTSLFEADKPLPTGAKRLK